MSAGEPDQEYGLYVMEKESPHHAKDALLAYYYDRDTFFSVREQDMSFFYSGLGIEKLQRLEKPITKMRCCLIAERIRAVFASRADSLQLRYFAEADGVSSGKLPRTASRDLLELLQLLLTTLPATASLYTVLHALQEVYATLGVDPELQNMASTRVGVRLTGNISTIFNVRDSRAYLFTNSVKGCKVAASRFDTLPRTIKLSTL